MSFFKQETKENLKNVKYATKIFAKEIRYLTENIIDDTQDKLFEKKEQLEKKYFENQTKNNSKNYRKEKKYSSHKDRIVYDPQTSTETAIIGNKNKDNEYLTKEDIIQLSAIEPDKWSVLYVDYDNSDNFNQDNIFVIKDYRIFVDSIDNLNNLMSFRNDEMLASRKGKYHIKKSFQVALIVPKNHNLDTDKEELLKKLENKGKEYGIHIIYY